MELSGLEPVSLSIKRSRLQWFGGLNMNIEMMQTGSHVVRRWKLREPGTFEEDLLDCVKGDMD